MDEDNEGGLYLSCNLCARPLSSMYKAACGHCYCEPCAEDHFNRDPHCPVDTCHMKLTQKHLSGPMGVGLHPTETLEAALYKNIFSSNLLQDVILNSLNAIPVLEGVLTFVASQTYFEVARAHRLRLEAEGKYKALRRATKAAEREWRNKEVGLEAQAKSLEVNNLKLNDANARLELYLDDLKRKTKSLEQHLLAAKAKGFTVNLPTPISTPPPQPYNTATQMPPPLALNSPMHGPGQQPRHSSSDGAVSYHHHQQQQQQQPPQQQYYTQHHQHHQQLGRSPSPSPRLLNTRPHSYGGYSHGHGHGPVPGTPSSTSGFAPRRGSAGPQGIVLGGGGGGGAGSMSSRHSPHRNAAVVSSSSSSSGHFGGGGGGVYGREPSPKPGYGLPMRY